MLADRKDKISRVMKDFPVDQTKLSNRMWLGEGKICNMTELSDWLCGEIEDQVWGQSDPYLIAWR